jgi:putative transposase
VAIGIDPGERQSVLGVSVSLLEAKVHSREFPPSLQARCLHRVKLIVSGAHARLRPGLDARMTDVPWKRSQST